MITAMKWLMYECSDCHPEADVYMDTMYVVLPDYVERPDYCPRCGSYLSLGEGVEVQDVRV